MLFEDFKLTNKEICNYIPNNMDHEILSLHCPFAKPMSKSLLQVECQLIFGILVQCSLVDKKESNRT